MAELGRLIGSFFYVGRLPMPGTWGSLAGLLLAWSFYEHLLAVLAIALVAGYACAFAAERCFGTRDPHAFVMDEVVGMMLSVFWLPHDLLWYAAAFGLFRFFDIAKPGFIRSLDKMDHPTCIMNDDVAAGAIVALILASIANFVR